MNLQLIRQTTMLIRLNKVILTSNTLKIRQHLINNAKSLHIAATNCMPRFSSDPKPNEIPSELPEKTVAQEVPPVKTYKNEEDAVWDAVEAGMFHGRRPKGAGDIPKVTFKGNRAFVQKDKKMFNMDEIDRKSKKHTEKKVLHTKPAKPKPVKKVSTAEEVYDEDIGKYLKLERDDPLVDKIMLQIQSKKHQDTDHPKFILEGRRLIQEAIEVGLKLETFIFSKIEQVKPIKDLILRSKALKYKVANHNLKLWSQLTTTPGVLGIFHRPENLNELIEKQRAEDEVIPVSIVLDNIREPNNMGAIIRVAAAAGAEQVILTKGCTNPWDLKCIRGSSGTHFRIKIIGPVEWPELPEHLPSKFEYYIADNHSGGQEDLPTIDYDALKFSKTSHGHKVLVIGGEAHGVSDEARSFLHESLQMKSGEGAIVRIPLVHKVNSLNVASALSVVLFEMRRKLRDQKTILNQL